MVTPGTSGRVAGYSEHFDRVPGCSKWSVGRHAQTLQVLLAHDVLAEEVASFPNFDKVVRAAVDGAEWAQNYRTHEVVTREPHCTVLHLAVYLDVSWHLGRELGDGAPSTPEARNVSLRVSRLVLALVRLSVFG